MTEKFLLNNIITTDEINYLEKYFNSRNEYVVTNGMKKYPVCHVPQEPEFFELVHNVIRDRIGIKESYELIGDNFYEHSYSYFPHCDALQSNSWLNIVIPIKLYNQVNDQKFIVFDQQFTKSNATWMGSYEMQGDFLSNKKITARICDTDGVINQTNKDIDENLYAAIENKYLSQDYLYSMSGNIFDWCPGNIIVFNSKFIHTTGKMNCSKKLGLSIRIGYNK